MVDVRLDNQSDYFCRITGEDLGVSRGTRDGDACWVPVIMTQLCLPATPRGQIYSELSQLGSCQLGGLTYI